LGIKVEKMKLRTIASLLLLVSLVLPWKITWGTNTAVAATSWFYIVEFPFMVESIIYNQYETWTSWELYNSVPKYVGTMLVLLGTILSLWGTVKWKREYLVVWGGILGLVGMVFFAGSQYEEVFIQSMLYQTYESLPLGMFIPVAFWLLIFIRPQEPARYVTKGQFRKLSFFCGECGREISSEFEFCPFCGEEIRKVTCKTCGKKISIQHTFCPYCGSKIQKEPEKALIL